MKQVDSHPAEDLGMSVSIVEDIKPLEEVEANLRAAIEQLHETGRPIIVTQHGKADVVMLDAADYERQVKTADLAVLLLEAEHDIAEGRTIPVEELVREFRGDEAVQS